MAMARSLDAEFEQFLMRCRKLNRELDGGGLSPRPR